MFKLVFDFSIINDYYMGILYLLCFVSSYLFTKLLMKILVNYKYGVDLHKKNSPKIPEMGGIVPVLLSTFVILLFLSNFAVALVIFLSGIVGICDDLYKLSPPKKLILLAIIGIPVGYLLFKSNIFRIIALMLGISIFSNLTNMLAGFNGLEIGLGIISAFFLGIILLLNGDYYGFEIVMVFVASYLGFFILNKYPARVFPGDVGTLPIGAFLATIALWKNVIPEFVIIMMPYIADAFLKYYSAGVTKREEHRPTTLGDDGKLHVLGGYLSLPRIILKKIPMQEYTIVKVIWGISIFCGIFAVLFDVFFK